MRPYIGIYNAKSSFVMVLSDDTIGKLYLYVVKSYIPNDEHNVPFG